jgi:microsomal dipeptidase-like Zn-dependent dipeptidase
MAPVSTSLRYANKSRHVAAVAAAVALLLAAPASARELAGGCFALGSVDGAYHLKPTGIDTYLLSVDGAPIAVGEGGVVEQDVADERAEWRIRPRRDGRHSITSTLNGRALETRDGELVLADGHSAVRLRPARGCTPFPEARVSATGEPRTGTNPDGTVFGFMDDHFHPTADMRAGGNVIYGQAFNRFGIDAALGRDVQTHGPDGSLDITGNLLRDGSPIGFHSPEGWPGFAGWPTYDTVTHQQTYYVWLQRAWMAGLRLVTAQTVEDESLCNIEILRTQPCDETDAIKRQIARLRALQDYVDAQSGGPGRGWLRIVTNPRQARRVIERGKLAVVIGMETSNPFGCSEFLFEPQCTREDIDRGLAELHRLGLRSMFIAHWTDNAFGGAAFEGGARGTFIGALQVEQTGHPFESEPCAGADESEGQCNTRGLTDLGRYLVRRLIERRMIIELDHLSQKARAEVMAIAEEADYPLISSHTGTGGEWTPEQLRELYAMGGLAAATPETAPELAQKILELRRYRSRRHFFGVALGTDTGGFAEQPGPRADAAADPLRYPFRAYNCPIKFRRQRTGTRTFDLNADGVAHYGLIADMVADMGGQPGGDAALRTLFSSAEAYLQMWERAYRR